MTKKSISLQKVADLFGTDVAGLGESCRKFYETINMNYRSFSHEEEKDLILDILKKIENDKQVIGAAERTQVWHNGWDENLQQFRQNKHASSVVPRFIRPNQVIRFDGEYILPENENFEQDYAKLMQLYIYDKFFTKDIENIYEFGAGSGFNLINIMNHNPNLNLYGSDFVQSSVDLINEFDSHYDTKFKGDLFDMLHPDYSYEIKENSCVFTHGALEQLAGNVKNIINFFLHKKPTICIHIEPTVEFYDEDNLFDYLQIKFHKKRGYSSGYLPYLQQLDKKGQINIVESRRLFFGSKFMEGYNLVVWKPL